MANLVVLVGLPGVGKSEYANWYGVNGYIICSSDDMRERLYGDKNDQEHNAEVFQTLHKEISDYLKNGCNVVYDACNVHSKRRIQFLNSIKGINCRKEAHVLVSPYEMVLERNKNRDRVVPEDVIERMYKTWQTPAEWEGYNNIRLVTDGCNGDYNVDDYDSYDQNSPYHKHTLGEHMKLAADYVAERTEDWNLYEAAIRHDIGKPFCEFKDKDGISHYYGHENVGAYDVLCDWTFDDEEALEVSRLINYHMYPIHWKAAGKTEHYQKQYDKYKELWGDEFFKKIILLHKADIASQ